MLAALTSPIWKVYRSYKDDWRKLCDLCRTTIVVDTPEQVAACLRALAAHQEVQLLKTANSYDALFGLRAKKPFARFASTP